MSRHSDWRQRTLADRQLTSVLCVRDYVQLVLAVDVVASAYTLPSVEGHRPVHAGEVGWSDALVSFINCNVIEVTVREQEAIELRLDGNDAIRVSLAAED